MIKTDTQKPIYNGMSIRQILSNLPDTFSKIERRLYIHNCVEIHHNEKHGINAGYNMNMRNTNFNLIQHHIR